MENVREIPLLAAKKTVQAELCRRYGSYELSAEHSLPDYRPEIARLLRVTASPLPPTQFIATDRAELTGSLDICALYADGEGSLCMTSFTEEYSFSVPLDGCDTQGSELICFADVEVEGVSARVSAPRRLGVRARLKARVSAFAEESPECNFSGEYSQESVQSLFGKVGINRVMRGDSARLMLGDEISQELPSEGEIRIVEPCAKVFISEVSSSEGAVNCRGEVIVKVLLCREEPAGDPFSVTKRLPFSARVPVEGADSDCSCRAFGRVLDISVTSEEGRILCEVCAVLTAEAQKNDELRYIRDLYSVDRACRCEVKERAYPLSVGCAQGNFTSGGSLGLDELSIEKGSLVLDCSGAAVIERIFCEGGRLVITGTGKYTLVLSFGAETFSKECALPFKYQTDSGFCDKSTGEIEADCIAEVVQARCRADGERITIDSEIAFSARVTKKHGIRAVTEVFFGEELAKDRGSYTVCYPEKGDSLWSVGKRYSCDLASLARANGIRSLDNASAQDSLSDTPFLLLF